METQLFNQPCDAARQSSQQSLYHQFFSKQALSLNIYEESLKMNDFQLIGSLTPKEINTRSNLLVWLIPSCLKQLELKLKTIDIGVRLFDYYCLKKCEVNKKQESCKVKGQKCGKVTKTLVLENKNQAKPILMTCLYLAAKYNEIYPPGIHDFLYYFESAFTKEEELNLQKEILLTTDFGFTRSTTYQWYQSISGQQMPEWALMLHCHSLLKAQHLARAVIHVQKYTKEDSTYDYTSNLMSRVLELLEIRKRHNKVDFPTRSHSASKGHSE